MNRLFFSSSSLTHLADSGNKSTNMYPTKYSLNRFLTVRVNSFLTHLSYFLSLSFLGYYILKSLNTRSSSSVPSSIDFLFTAVSAATGSSMSTVEMEVFSNSHLLFMTFLMFVGGEVFTSLIGLLIKTRKLKKRSPRTNDRVASIESGGEGSNPATSHHHKQLDLEVVAGTPPLPAAARGDDDKQYSSLMLEADSILEYKSTRFLCYVVLSYLILIQVLGISLISLYLALERSARDLLREKGLSSFTFSLFTVISTFVNCGFVPTNENMMAFKKNSVMLLVLIPQVLLGNTLFPPCLRLCIWLAGKVLPKKNEESSRFLLNEEQQHSDDDDEALPITNGVLLRGRHSAYLAATVAGFVAVQFVMLCGLDWNSEGMEGLSSVEKVVGGIFVAVNSRHAGESIVDLSTLSPAVLVVFIVMMYFPPYTSFLPREGKQEEDERNIINPHSKRTRQGGIIIHDDHKSRRKVILENLIFSQLSFLVAFVFMVCITEREKLRNDPLNFNVFNIALEVVSAYGNVGFSMGYSCKRRINPSGDCEDKWYGFAGKWSDEGKIVLILVMLFGKLKKFNVNGGKAWKLL